MQADLTPRYVNDMPDLARGESTSENRDRETLESRGILQRPVYREQVLSLRPPPLPPSSSFLSISFSPSFISLPSSPAFSMILYLALITERTRARVSTGTHLARTHTHTRASRNAQDGLRCE